MYVLGIDLGTTFTAAATLRDGRPEMVSLGGKSVVIPSVVLRRDDGTILTGTAAERRGVTEPERLAREFKRRFGDHTPLLLGGTPLAPEALTAELLRAVVDLVTEREGGPPDRICLTHPANWGPFKRDLLSRAARQSGIEVPISLISEPAAAAAAYAGEQRVPAGAVVAVYDFGGGTFDAAVLGARGDGFELLGTPEGIEQLGGIDLDAAVFEHVTEALGAHWTDLDEDDPAAVAGVARLRAECVEAKEALSSDTDVSIPVLLPNLATEVRLTRAELESMARPMLYSTIDALRRALVSARVEPADLDSVLLVGGASRMPLVAQLVGAELGRPVAVDAHPKHAVALGAARIAGAESAPDTAVPAAGPEPAAAVEPVAAVETTVLPEPAGSPVTAELPATAGAPVTAGLPIGRLVLPSPRPPLLQRRSSIAAIAVTMLVLLALGLFGWSRYDRAAAAATAQRALDEIADRDATTVRRDLWGSWVPQISAESSGDTDYTAVLAAHRESVDRVPGALLVRAGDYPRVFDRDAGYVTLGAVAFPGAAEVFDWCAGRALDDRCVARRLTDADTPAANTVRRSRTADAAGSTPGSTTGSARTTDASASGSAAASSAAAGPSTRDGRPATGGSGIGRSDAGGSLGSSGVTEQAGSVGTTEGAGATQATEGAGVTQGGGSAGTTEETGTTGTTEGNETTQTTETTETTETAGATGGGESETGAAGEPPEAGGSTVPIPDSPVVGPPVVDVSGTVDPPVPTVDPAVTVPVLAGPDTGPRP